MEQLKLSKNTAKLHQMFGKKLYSDRFSFISEMCQNAVDSHRMSGQKDPVMVGIKKENGKMIFYIQDFGLSFSSKEDFVAKVCTILESGKTVQKTNEEDCPMGMHGIGSISVSAFQSEWMYTVIKDKRKFTATLKEIEGVGLTYELGDYEETEEKDTVLFEVRVPEVDLYGITEAIKRKLCYFKDILFSFDEELYKIDNSLLTINSTFEIFQSDDFQISTLSAYNELHICIDQYSYRIRWHELGIDPIKLNIGLRFGMNDGLTPDITRENLYFTPEYKDVVMAKIKLVSDWFVNRWNKEVSEPFESVSKVSKYILGDRYITLNNVSYPINPLLSHTTTIPIQPSFKDVDTLTLLRFVRMGNGGLDFFQCRHEINSKGDKVKKTYNASDAKWLCGYNKMILAQDPKLPEGLNRYLKGNMKGYGLFFKKKISLKDYFSLYGLVKKSVMRAEYMKSGRNIWREYIQKVRILEDSVAKDYFIDVNSIEVPKEYMERKKTVPKRKDKGTITIRYGKYGKTGYNCKYEEKVFSSDELHKIPSFHVYGSEEEKERLNDLFYMCYPSRYASKTKRNNISVCIVTPTQQKLIKKLNNHNFMSIEDFFSGKHTIFKSVMTAYMLHTFKEKYPIQFKNIRAIKDHLSEEFAGDLQDIVDYTGKYHWENYFSSVGKSTPLLDALVAFTVENKLYDLSIWGKFQKVKDNIENFDFLCYFESYLAPYIDDSKKKNAVKAMVEICKYRKIRIDTKNYSK